MVLRCIVLLLIICSSCGVNDNSIESEPVLLQNQPLVTDDRCYQQCMDQCVNPRCFKECAAHGPKASCLKLCEKEEKLCEDDCSEADCSIPPPPPIAPVLRSEVFDWHYYLANNIDLLFAGINTETAAISHWRAFGIKEGRRAHASFWSVQYLSIYTDLRSAFGTNYQAAIEHYIASGIAEGRRGI